MPLPTGRRWSPPAARRSPARPTRTTINQSSQNAAINWQSFSIGAGETVQFVAAEQQLGRAEPRARRRPVGDPRQPVGQRQGVPGQSRTACCSATARRSTSAAWSPRRSNISDADFMAGRYSFTGAGRGAVVNQGTITADGGYVALLGASVSNQGVISAQPRHGGAGRGQRDHARRGRRRPAQRHRRRGRGQRAGRRTAA